jgi:hypothetical protein
MSENKEQLYIDKATIGKTEGFKYENEEKYLAHHKEMIAAGYQETMKMSQPNGNIIASYELTTEEERKKEEERLLHIRKVGSYIDPKTGEEFWLEPDTVDMIPMSPAYNTDDKTGITMLYHVGLTNNDEERTIIVYVYKDDNPDKRYGVKIDEEEFANILSDTAINHEYDICL